MDDPKSSYVYVTYIRTTPEALWEALTEPAFMRQYWFGMHIETDWRVGAAWTLRHPDGRAFDGGEVVAFDPPRRIELTWRHAMRPELQAEGIARCVMELEAQEAVVKLTIAHSIGVADSKLIGAVSGGWPKIISNLKSLLETGAVLLT